MADKKLTENFETKTCGRCGGSGLYSWTRRYGSTCFQCMVRPHQPGSGVTYTKRGLAARQYMESLLSKRADEFEVGDLFRDTLTGKWHRIEKIKREGETIYLCAPALHWGCQADSVIRFGATAEQKTKARTKALEYQATLTKAGKPRKRRGNAA